MLSVLVPEITLLIVVAVAAVAIGVITCNGFIASSSTVNVRGILRKR